MEKSSFLFFDQRRGKHHGRSACSCRQRKACLSEKRPCPSSPEERRGFAEVATRESALGMRWREGILFNGGLHTGGGGEGRKSDELDSSRMNAKTGKEGGGAVD